MQLLNKGRWCIFIILIMMISAKQLRAQNAEIQILPSDTSAALGDTLEITVSVSNGNLIGAFEFEIEYSPNIVEIDSVKLGSFLSSTGRMAFPLNPIWHNVADKKVVRFAGFSAGEQAGASGDGLLAIMKISTRGIGQTGLHFVDVVLTKANGQEQSIKTITDGTITVNPGIADSLLSTITADPVTIPADGNSTSLITVIPRDPAGNILHPGQLVQLQTTAGTLIGSLLSHEDGSYTQQLRSSATVETAIITATVNGKQLQQQAQVEFSEKENLILRIAPPDTTVYLGNQVTIGVAVDGVWDLGGFEIVLQYSTKIITVDSLYLGGFLSSTGRTTGMVTPVIENGQVSFSGFSIGSRAGANGSGVLVYLRVTPLSLGNTAIDLKQAIITDTQANAQEIFSLVDGSITVSASAVDSVLTTITANPTDIPADGISTSLITVIPRDAAGNLLPTGQQVQIQTTAGTLIGDVVSNENGSYTQQLRSSTTIETAIITATVNSTQIQQQAQVEFSQKENLIVSLAPTDTTVYLGNQFTIAVSVSGAWNLGSFEISLQYSTKIITIDSLWLGDFLSSSGRSVSMTDPVIENGHESGRVAFNGFSFGNGQGPAGSGVLTYLRVTPVSLGNTVIDLKQAIITDTQANAQEISSLIDGSITVSASTADPQLTTVTADSSTIPADGFSTSLITVIPRDAAGNILPAGQLVQLQTTAGTLLGNIQTHQDGSYTQQLLSSTTPQTATVTAIVNGVQIQQQAQVIFSKKPGLKFWIAPSDTSILQGNSFEISVNIDSVWDLAAFEFSLQYAKQILTFENVEPGDFLGSTGRKVGLRDTLFDLSSTIGIIKVAGFSFGNEPGPIGCGEIINMNFQASATGITNLNLADIKITNTKAQLLSVDSSLHGTVTVVDAVVDPDSTTISAIPDTIPADAVSKSLITVIPRNPDGIKLGSGQSVVLQTSSGNLLDEVTDHGDGTYSQLLQSVITPGTATITATVNNISINQQATVVFAEPAKIYPTAAAYTHIAGKEFWVNIQLGSANTPIPDLNKVNLVLSNTKKNMISCLMDSVQPGTFFGKKTDVDFNVSITPGNISVETGTKSGASAPNNFGVVARLKFKSDAYTIDSTLVSFTINSVTATNTASQPVTITPDSLLLTIRGVIVFPGDTNNDNVVNHIDLLPIGLCYNSTGPSRSGATTNWIGQHCTRWRPEVATYADADGNGVVNRSDASVVTLNWQKRHELPTARINVQEIKKLDYKGLLKPIVHYNNRSELVLDLELHDVDNLLGIAFSMNYPSELLEIVSFKPGSFFSNDDLFMKNFSKNNNTVSISLSSVKQVKNKQIPNHIATIVLKSNLPENSAIELKFDEVIGLTTDGKWFAISAESWFNAGIVANTPTQYVLHQNYPNPFNSSTIIKYELPEPGKVEIKIYNALGNEIAILVNENKDAGEFKCVWDGKNASGEQVSSGIYFYEIIASGFRDIKKCIFMK